MCVWHELIYLPIAPRERGGREGEVGGQTGLRVIGGSTHKGREQAGGGQRGCAGVLWSGLVSVIEGD